MLLDYSQCEKYLVLMKCGVSYICYQRLHTNVECVHLMCLDLCNYTVLVRMSKHFRAES